MNHIIFINGTAVRLSSISVLKRMHDGEMRIWVSGADGYVSVFGISESEYRNILNTWGEYLDKTLVQLEEVIKHVN